MSVRGSNPNPPVFTQDQAKYLDSLGFDIDGLKINANIRPLYQDTAATRPMQREPYEKPRDFEKRIQSYQDQGIIAQNNFAAETKGISAIQPNAEEICDACFRYMFHNPEIDGSAVDGAFFLNDGIVRYSMQGESMIGRIPAIIVFGAARLVLRFRNKIKDSDYLVRMAQHSCFTIGQLVNLTKLPEETIIKELEELCRMGVFSEFVGISLGNKHTEVFGFNMEDAIFPEMGTIKL